MEYDRLKKRYFLELQEQLAKSERRHAEEIEQLSQQLSYQIQYNNSLLEHLQQLELQQRAAQDVVMEAKKLLHKTASERDNVIEACSSLQQTHQSVVATLATVTHERDEQVEECKHLSYNNKLFRDELSKVREDIDKYKDMLEKSKEETGESATGEAGGYAANKDMMEHQMALVAEVEALQLQLMQLDRSVSMERDRVEVLDLQLNKEEKHQALLAEHAKLTSQHSAKENEAKSLSMDVDFLQNELKTAHKQAANYALERDERSTMCDALSAHVTKLQDKIAGLEAEGENLRKIAESQRESYENEIQQLHDDNNRLLSDLHTNAQNHQAELSQKASEAEEMKQNYEESMRDYCTTLTQQCTGIQATLQEELRRILAEKSSVVQAAREDKVNDDAQIALLTSRLTSSETLAREMETRYRGELDTLRRERDWLHQRVNELQASALDSYSNFEEGLKECKDLCVTLMSHYSTLLASVAPLPSVIQSLCNDQHSQAEVSLGQIQLLSQQYSGTLVQMEKANDEKRMLGVLLEEEKSKSLMLQDSNASIQRMLQAAQAQGAVAQELSLVVDSKTQETNSLGQEIQALQEELQQQRVTASSLLAKLDVAHCQLQIVNEENERSLNTFAETTLQHSHQVAELEERIQSLQAQLQASQTQLTTATRETSAVREVLDTTKTQHQAALAHACEEVNALVAKVKDLSSQVQDLNKFKAQAAEQQQLVSEVKQQASQAQNAVLALQEQRKLLQSENIELKEELEHLYKHQQLLTTLQQQQQHNIASRTEPKLDTSIMEALKKQNRLIEDKCKMLQDNSMKMMKDFALHSVSPTPQSPDIDGSYGS